MKRIIMIAALAAFTAAAGENLIFEKWNAKSGFSVQEQSSAIHRSGKYSIHLKDEDKGNVNQSLQYALSSAEVKRAAGKLLRFTAYVRQVSASKPGVVGIGVWIRDREGKVSALNQGVDSTGETDWLPVTARLAVPGNAAQILIFLNCAHGFRNTGEAYFDDLELVIEEPGAAAPLPVAGATAPGRSVAKTPEHSGIFLSLLPLPKLWQLRFWGGLRLKNKEMPLLFDSREAKANAGIELRTEMLEYHYDLTSSGLDRLRLRLETSYAGPLQFRFESGEGKSAPFRSKPVAAGEGSWRHEFQLNEVKDDGALADLSKVSIQFPEAPGTATVVIRELAILADSPEMKAEFRASKEAADYRAKYRDPLPVFEDDGKPRPVIENGTWYLDGRPVFFLGPWLYSRNETNWNQMANPLGIKHIAYNEAPSVEVFREVGFNSGQISAAIMLPGAARYGAPLPEDIKGQEERSRAYFDRYRGMPMVVDFAFGFKRLLEQGNPALYREIDQRNGHWHAFIPFCPEHPEGDRYYRDFMLAGATATLRAGGNPMIWELFNESSYNCQCRFNAAAFAMEMKLQYKEIVAANRVWGTVFASFDDLKAVTHFEQYRGLWPDWCKYSTRRYAQLLRQYRDVVRSVDHRPRVYFTEQLAVPNILQARGAGMDYRLIADALDLLATESGWKYGNYQGEGSGNPMEDAAVGGNLKYSFISDFYRAVGKDKKPVMNHEYYCGRFEFGKRVPSRAADLITGMWGEIFHGLSGSYHYVWDKRPYDWKTFEQAKANVLKPTYKSYSMLNPYNWPPEELDAGKRFMAELEPYSDRLLPMPRITGEEVALFFSYPTLRMQALNREDYQKKILNWYSAALYGNYPVRIVFEEELASLSAKVLLIPSATHVIPAMMKDLAAFSKRGGVIVADKAAFQFDEYGHPLPVVNFAVTRFDAASAASIPEVRKALAAARRPVAAAPADGGGDFHEMEIHLIDRGDFKLALLVNFGDRQPRLARLTFDLADQGEFYLFDPVAKQLLTHPGKETWNAAELKRGVEVVLPPQERLLLGLDRKRPAALGTLPQAEMPALLKKRLEACRPELEALAKEEAESLREKAEARMYQGVPAEKCVPLDLRKAVNMAFRDEIADDGKGGWFDQGENDFANMPLGKITAAGVPFEIIDPAGNGERSVLILRGKERSRFPEKAEGIPVGLRAKRLYFLHTSGWTPKTGTTVLTYRLNYADGTKLEIPVRSGHEIGGWWGSPILTDAKIAVEAANAVRPLVNLQCFRWDNPHPEKEIKSLDIRSACGEGVPAVVAVTVEQ